MLGERDSLKIAIPTEWPRGLEARISEHLGRCSTLTIVEIENGRPTEIEVIPNEGHLCEGEILNRLLARGVRALLARGIGWRALHKLNSAGIRVYLSEAETVREAIDRMLEGDLKPAEEGTCEHRGGYCHERGSLYP